MTREPETVPDAGAHPEPGQIAAHAERRLAPAEAGRIDEHLAGCPICHEVFAETLRFGLDEEAEEAPPGHAAGVIPFARRPAFRLAAGLAVAASVLVVFQQLWRARSERPAAPLVAELAQAIGTRRFIEPRLTGGFQHGRLVILRSGDRPQGLDAHTPSVLDAVAQIRKRAQGDTTPEALAALAVTYLVSGDIAKAVRTLESATAQDPKNPRLQSDLAAAYLVRASRLDEPADIPKALEAAETAIAIPDAPPEAWFNRALALEQLHLVDSAKKAWEDFLERDSTSAWADEARKHIEELPPAQQSTLEEDRARARAAIAQGQAGVDRLADDAPQVLRAYFDNELLAEWADAQLTGHTGAVVLRAHAQQVGQAVFRATGDALQRDAAMALASAPSAASRDPPRSQAQALGHKAFLEAQRLHDLGQPSCAAFRDSHRLLQAGGSPYAAWARERVLVTCLYPRKNAAVLPELARIESDARQKQHCSLLARALWMTALAHSDAGDYDRAVQHYRRAQQVYRALRDPEGEASVALRLAYALNSSGDSRAGWREGLRALGLSDTLDQPARREEALFLIAVASWQDGLAASAVHVLTEVADLTRQHGRLGRIALALTWRAQALYALGQQERAAADLAEARRVLSSAGDIPYADNIEAFLDVAEGRLLESAQPEEALASLQRAMPYFEEILPALVPALRVDVARVLRARGRDGEAEAELAAAIREVESQASLGDAGRQGAFFDYAASRPFDEMVALQLDARDNPLRALQYVERSRGRQLRAALVARPRASPRRAGSSASPVPAPLSPEALQRLLPEGVALVYYVVLPDRVAAWVLSRGESRYFRLPAAPDELRRRVAGYELAVEGGEPLALLREPASALFDAIVRPLLPALAGHESLVLLPDGALQSLPFPSLWNRESGRYLVEDYRLSQSPSGAVFLHATAAATRSKSGSPPHLLAVGNPRLAPESGLPQLPGSEREAGDVARLYSDSELLLAADATQRAFLEGLGRSDVVHFAGHAVQGDLPGSGRLMFAPDRDAGESGAVRADEIAASDLERTRLVVLAGCRTATGERSRFEGVRGVTRPFLAAGVPMVVASLWDVDDAASRAFFLEFHRHFLAEGEAASAVRVAQLALLGGDDPVLAHPSKWAGFVSFGGLVQRVDAAGRQVALGP